MGTNYYIEVNCCDKCGRGEATYHIGKSSCGHPFIFNTYGVPWPTVDVFFAFLQDQKDYIIKDEYDRQKSLQDLMETIYRRRVSEDQKKYHTFDEKGYSFSRTEFS